MEERNKWLTDLRVCHNKKHRLYVSDAGVQDEPRPQQKATPLQSDSEDDDDEQTVRAPLLEPIKPSSPIYAASSSAATNDVTIETLPSSPTSRLSM